jgi:hypothetical protein
MGQRVKSFGNKAVFLGFFYGASIMGGLGEENEKNGEAMDPATSGHTLRLL